MPDRHCVLLWRFGLLSSRSAPAPDLRGYDATACSFWFSAATFAATSGGASA